MRPQAIAACLAVLCIASGAARSDDLWTRATLPSEAEGARHLYEENMRLGDEYAIVAASDSTRAADRRRLALRAVLAFENAARALPDAAEPHFRAGLTLATFFIDCERPTALCNPGRMLRREAEQVIAHWNEFERLAPLDPRIDGHFLFFRAILHTRLGTPEHVEQALVDYKKILERGDFAAGSGVNGAVPFEDWGTTYSNMAETYMMLGRLDEAIAAYRDSLRFRQHTPYYYGLAVALDRDEQGAQARELIVTLGQHAFETFQAEVASGGTFYVPDEEKYYYFALAAEALGHDEPALRYWDRFIQSGIYPQFQARAIANRNALARRRGRP